MRWSGVFSGKYPILVVLKYGADVPPTTYIICDGYNRFKNKNI